MSATSNQELTAGSARLNTEIANLEKEVAKNSAALDQATALRKKERWILICIDID